MLDIKSLVQGAGITVTNNANDITIACTITQGATAAANIGNVGAGTAGSYASLIGTTMNFKRINQGANVTVSEDASNIYISAAGAAGGTIGGAINPNQVAYCNIANEITGDGDPTDSFEYFDSIHQMKVSDVKARYPIFDVRWFGAVGDGVTDDTAAIQLAIDTCSTAGGGTVFCPGRNPVGSGNYYHVTGQGGGGNGTALQMKAGVSLLGAGTRQSVINWGAAATTGEILDTTGIDIAYTSIRDLQFSCTGAGSTVNGIKGGSTLAQYNSGICTFESLLFYGLSTGIIGNGAADNGFFDCEFRDVTFAACGNGLNTYGSGNHLYNCRFYQCSSNGLVIGYLSPESMGGHNLFGCTFIQNQYDIYVTGTEVRSNSFSGCWFETSTHAIINVPAPLKSQMLTFDNCTFNSGNGSGLNLDMLNVANIDGVVNITGCSLLTVGAGQNVRIIGDPTRQRLNIKNCVQYLFGGGKSYIGTDALAIVDRNGSNQNVTTGVDTTVAFNHVYGDRESCFDTGTYKYTCKYNGTYLIRANVTFGPFDATTANPYIFLRLSSGVIPVTVRQAPVSTTDLTTLVLVAAFSAAVGETFEIRAHHSNAAAVAVIQGAADLTNLHVSRIY